MLQYEIAKKVYEEIMEKANKNRSVVYSGLYESYLKSAVNYATKRAEYTFMELEEQIENDRSRSIKHDAYMSNLSAVCRNLKIEGIDEIMPDRKTKGDFACYIVMFLGLEQR